MFLHHLLTSGSNWC